MKCKDIPDLEVLQLAKEWSDDVMAFIENDGSVSPLSLHRRLVAKYGNEKVCLAKIIGLIDRGMLEYGAGPRCSWLTQEGEDYLNAHPK